MKKWSDCKKVLCIRPDNMGDLLMSTPAIRALKATYDCSITVLTSSMAAGIARHIPEIDETIEFNVPWVKSDSEKDRLAFFNIIEIIKQQSFDAAVIFTVYSQNPLPSAMIAYLAGIPLRLGYCRENPYELLTDWVPDKEPYEFVQHQVMRDLGLVASIGAYTKDKRLSLRFADSLWANLETKLTSAGADINNQWIILHPGVSEAKRAYPTPLWIEAGRKLIKEFGCQLLISGNSKEEELAQEIVDGIGTGAFCIAGKLNLEEFMVLLKYTPVVVSVNTGTIHIAAAAGTPVVVLYALTNPQHAPWQIKGKVLVFDIPKEERSKNEVIQYVHEHIHPQQVVMPTANDIVSAVKEILTGNAELIPEMICLQQGVEQIF